MIERSVPRLRSLRRPLAAGVGALYLVLAILAHFAHETPARAAASLDPLGLGAPICWGAKDAADTSDAGPDAPVCEACLLAKSLAAPPPSETAALAGPTGLGVALVSFAPVGQLTPPPARRPPARGPPPVS
ncbi:MAG: hypothetical protein RIB97_10075 [Nitratireductor sp.]